MMKNARQIAFEVLLKMEKDKAYSNLALDSAVKASGLGSTDCAFLSRLVYGVTERKLTLDAAYERFLTGGGAKRKQAVRTVLRLGVFQLYYLDKIPVSAAVNESVKLAKDNGLGYAAGMVNAVLHKCAAAPFAPDEALSCPERISLLYSAPLELVRFLMHHYGQENTEAFLLSALEKKATYLRVNTVRISPEALKARLTAEGVSVQDTMLENALQVDAFGDITALASFREGLFHVEDLSSQLCAAALGALPGERVKDVCAAPSGKSFTIAQSMENTGSLVACDLYKHRTQLIAEGAKRLGLNMIETRVCDASLPDTQSALFDRVLCDVPCSGLGVIGRKPEIKYKPLDDAKALLPMQKAILEAASGQVRPGGTLVYSTCSVNPHENKGVCEAFLASHPEFVAVPVFPELRRVVPEENTLTLFPHIHGCDGFFIAKMIRK